MKEKTFFCIRFFTVLLTLAFITFYSCSNNGNTTDSDEFELVAAEEVDAPVESTPEINIPPTPKVTFQGLPIEGSERAFIDSLKSKGFKVEKSETNDFRLMDFQCVTIHEDAPKLYKRLHFYSCEPKSQAKDAEPEYSQVFVTFFDGELWKIQVGLTYHHSTPPIADLASEFGNKYATTMSKRELSESYVRLYGGDRYIYTAKIGNTNVAISKYAWFAGFENAAFEYINAPIDTKIWSLKSSEEDEIAKNAIDML